MFKHTIWSCDANSKDAINQSSKQLWASWGSFYSHFRSFWLVDWSKCAKLNKNITFQTATLMNVQTLSRFSTPNKVATWLELHDANREREICVNGFHLTIFRFAFNTCRFDRKLYRISLKNTHKINLLALSNQNSANPAQLMQLCESNAFGSM